MLHDLAAHLRRVQAKSCEKAAIALSLQNLMSFPWIRQRVDAGSLTLHGWYFDIDAGELLQHSAETGEFIALVSKM